MSGLTDNLPADLVRQFQIQFETLLSSAAAASTGPKFVLALSGGADSVALLRLMIAAGYKKRLRCVHVNHQLQDQAVDWEGFCKQLCAAQGVLFTAVSVELDSQQRKSQGLEAAARNARYEALLSGFAADETLLTAHHANDQVETLLHRLERGTGLLGLQGIHPVSRRDHDGRSIPVLRPLLSFNKADLLRFLQGMQQGWCEDPSNQDTQYRRNFYRQNVVPELGAGIEARLLGITQQSSELAARWLDTHKRWCENRSVIWQGEPTLELQDGDFETPELLKLHLQYWFKSQQMSLPNTRLIELIRQLKKGSALGHNPSYATLSQGMFVSKRRVQVRRL